MSTDFSLEEPNNQSQWDLVITPKRHLLYLPVKDLLHYRDLLWLFIRRDFVAFYKQTILGPLWFIIQPILTTLMMTLVFGNIAGLSTDGLPRVLFYLAGVTLWTYFADCLTKTATTFVDNVHLFGKVYFPRLITPLSSVISSMLKFFIQLAIFLGILLVKRQYHSSIDSIPAPRSHHLPCNDKPWDWTNFLGNDDEIPRLEVPPPVRSSIADVCHTSDIPGFNNP